MKTLNEVSEQFKVFADFSGFDIEKIRLAMKSNGFLIKECETHEEMVNYGVDYNYPFVISNPFNICITKEGEKSMTFDELCNDNDLIIQLKKDISNTFGIPVDNIHLVSDAQSICAEAGDGLIYHYDESAVNNYIEKWVYDTLS